MPRPDLLLPIGRRLVRGCPRRIRSDISHAIESKQHRRRVRRDVDIPEMEGVPVGRDVLDVGSWAAAAAMVGLVVGSPSLAAPPCADGTTVTTSKGAVCGIVVNGVNEWLGIP